MINLRKLRPWNLTSPEYSHLLLALFWVLHGLVFSTLETFVKVENCHVMWCPLDDRIPFNEWFFIPYMFWFVFVVGMNIYLALCDPRAFRRFMYFIMVTSTVTLVTYMVYPTCQNLRPESFERDNFMTRFAASFYAFDTNTNVCPSLHVINSFAVTFGAWDTKRFKTPFWRVSFFLMAVLISVSTLFVKQHSFVDVAAALVVTVLGYLAVYVIPDAVRKRKAKKAE